MDNFSDNVLNTKEECKMKKALGVLVLILVIGGVFLYSQYNKTLVFKDILSNNGFDYNNIEKIEILTGNLDTIKIDNDDGIKKITAYMDNFKFKRFIRNSIINSNAENNSDKIAYKLSIIDSKGNEVSVDPSIPLMKFNGKHYKIISGESDKDFFSNLIRE